MVKKTIVADIVENAKKTSMKLSQFFISWNGVPTLAYEGFTPSLLEIKKSIGDCLPGLGKENPGTKWPKTTLGSLRDDKTLSLDDMLKLRKICNKSNEELRGLSFDIDALSIVLFHCRSLERRISTQVVSLKDPLDADTASDEERTTVTKTMNQFAESRLVEYFPKIQQLGNRESHYRSPFVEATLVYDLKHTPKPISQFRIKVDEILPGMYCWFEDESLHMTVRALA
jgi:hypothetical protein